MPSTAPGVGDHTLDPNGRIDSSTQALANFAAVLTDSLPEGTSVGFLPLATYRASGRSPVFSDLGEDVSDRAATLVANAGLPGTIVDTAGMRFRVRRANLERDQLVSLEGVGTKGLRLGLDVVVSGTIRENRKPGIPHSLSVDLHAIEMQSGNSLARERFEVQDADVGDSDLWVLYHRDSLWDQGAWNTPTVERTLAAELAWAAAMLAKDVAPALQELSTRVAVAPVETSSLVSAVAHLRAVQRDWGTIEADRRARGQAEAASVELDGRVFEDLMTARTYVERLHDDISSAPFLAFSRDVAFQVEAALRQERVSVVGSTTLDLDPWTDPSFMRASAATARMGAGLLTNVSLEENGIGAVVLPTLSRIGNTATIRLEAVDVRTGAVLGSSYWPLEPASSAELLAPLEEVSTRTGSANRQDQADAQGSWSNVLGRVASGIVRINVPTGSRVSQGTGFVVDAKGIILTNAHVVDGSTGTASIEFESGTKISAEVVEVDPYWDIALLKATGLPPAAHVFELKEDASVGAEVALMGHPKNTSGWVLSAGYVSSLDETAQTSGRRPSTMYTCITRSGSSGSPVFGRDGRVIAVHSHGMRGTVQGLAIPSGELFSEMPGFALGAPASSVIPIISRVIAAY